VDNFAGGGGVSSGIERALAHCVDIAVNHDAETIAMHTENHLQTKHYQEDVFAIDSVKVTEGRPVGLARFSPD
jgi:DNA (cytosine-5)-methyltransferase 1